MYTISESFKRTVVENTREWNIYIDVVLSNGTPLRLTKENLALGTFSFKEGSTCGSTIQVGSTYSNSVMFTLENSDGKFEDIDFYGASVRPFIGLWLDDIQDFEYIPLGEFFVTEPTRRLASIPIVCFDAMSKLNVVFDFSTILFPTRASTILSAIAEQTGVSVTESLVSEVSELNQSIGSFLTNGSTCRDVLAGIGILLKKNLRFNRAGSLESFWYQGVDGATEPSTRVGNSSYGDSEISITGVYLEDAFGNVFSSGTGEYPVQLPKSPVIQNSDMAQPLLDSILTQLQSVPCRLQNITWIGNPAVQAGDILTSKNTPTGNLTTPVMASTYKFAGTCILECYAPSAESVNQQTSTEKQLRNIFDKTIRDRIELETAIEQTSESITLRVSRVEEQVGTLSEDLSGFSESVTDSLSDLQSQIDGQIMTWFDDYAPTATNEPASSWTTNAERDKHLGDVFYIVDNETQGGQAYRWAKVDSTYKWILIEDVEVAKALADAAKAQDTADGKRRVFVNTPKPPYDVGDLWAQGASGDLMRCNKARQTGSYVASDWGRATDYTNDDSLNEFIAGDYKTTTTKLAELVTTTTSISARVEQTETTVTTVQNDLENLSIGGTNLLLDTDAPSLTKVAADYDRRFTTSVNGTDAIGTIDPLSNSPCGTKNAVRINMITTDGFTSGIVFYNTIRENVLGISFVPGEQYTMSCYARAISGEPKINMTIWGLTACGWRDVPGEWTKFSLTFTATEAFNTTTSAWAVFRLGESIGAAELTGFKIEKGNKATDWTPAPEDTQVQIDGVVSDVADQQVVITSQESRIANLEVNNESIEASVSKLTSETQTTLDGIETTISELEKKAGLAITEEDVTIAIESKLENADGIFITGTDYGFSADGLRIAKDGQAMESLLDNSGLEVSRSGEAILTADDTGVNALNLTARQYLIVGDHARFENYETGRTACFWI